MSVPRITGLEPSPVGTLQIAMEPNGMGSWEFMVLRRTEPDNLGRGRTLVRVATFVAEADAETFVRVMNSLPMTNLQRLRFDAMEAQRDRLLALCERATIESARVHPEFMAALRTAIKATKADQ